ncbi:MAG: hypothetical protein CBC55_02235 [Gammaproteobacteria bacterium TMED95]|nr:MAG: hypothetical protein CBC55_02235 [Gammaproteobacteria bacterium TMED95]
MNSRNLNTLSLVIAATLSLSACGGSSSNETPTTPVADTTPDTFSLGDSLYNAPNAEVTSEVLTITGINADTSISVDVGMYRVNGGNWTDADGNVANGDTVEVQLKAPDTYLIRNSGNTPVAPVTESTLTIGGVSATFTVGTGQDAQGVDIAADNTDISDISPAQPSESVTTDPLTLSGIDTSVLVVVETGDILLNGVNAGQSTSAESGDVISIEVNAPSTYGEDLNVAYLIGDAISTFDVITYDSEDDVPATYTFTYPDCEENPTLTVCIGNEEISLITWEDDGGTITGEYTFSNGEPITLENVSANGLNVSVVTSRQEASNIEGRYADSYIGLAPGEYDVVSPFLDFKESIDDTVDCNHTQITLLDAVGRTVSVKGMPDYTQAYINDIGTLENGQRTITVSYCDVDELYITDSDGYELFGSAIVTLNGDAPITAQLEPASSVGVNAQRLAMEYVSLFDDAYTVQGSVSSSEQGFLSADVTFDGRTATPSGLNLFARTTELLSLDDSIFKQFIEIENVNANAPIDIEFGTHRAIFSSDAAQMRNTGVVDYLLEGTADVSFVKATATYTLLDGESYTSIIHNVYVTPTSDDFDGDASIVLPKLEAFDSAVFEEISASFEVGSYSVSDAANLSEALTFVNDNADSTYAVKYSNQRVSN